MESARRFGVGDDPALDNIERRDREARFRLRELHLFHIAQVGGDEAGFFRRLGLKRARGK